MKFSCKRIFQKWKFAEKFGNLGKFRIKRDLKVEINNFAVEKLFISRQITEKHDTMGQRQL